MPIKAEYLYQKELDHVLALLTPQNALCMRVCLHTGLRVGDVLKLRRPVKRQFWITEEKTGKRRRVNLTDSLVQELNGSGGGLWCFPGRLDPKKHRTRQAVWKDVVRARNALRLPVHISPHSARKIYASDAMAAGESLDRIKRRLNHGSKTTTNIYAMAEALFLMKYERGPDGRLRRRCRRRREK